MRKRNKTLQAMLEKANAYLKGSDDSEIKGREMLATFVSAFLMEQGSYNGYAYIYWKEQGYAEWITAGEPEGKEKDKFLYGPSGDKSRIHYY